MNKFKDADRTECKSQKVSSGLTLEVKDIFTRYFNPEEVSVEVVALFMICLILLLATYRYCINLNDYVSVYGSGYNTYGRLETKIDKGRLEMQPYMKELIPTIQVTYDEQFKDTLENGDIVIWEIAFDKTLAQEKGVFCMTESENYVVEKLELLI